MAVEIKISHVIEKLQNLLLPGKESTNPGLRKQVEQCMDILEKFRKLLEGFEDEQGEINECKTELLRIMYQTEDAIDSFVVRTSLQKPNAFFKAVDVRSFFNQTHLSNKMEKVVRQLTQQMKMLQQMNNTSANLLSTVDSHSETKHVSHGPEEDTSKPNFSDEEPQHHSTTFSVARHSFESEISELRSDNNLANKDTSEPNISAKELEHHSERLSAVRHFVESEISEPRSSSNLGDWRLLQMDAVEVSEEMFLPIDLPNMEDEEIPILKSQNVVEYRQDEDMRLFRATDLLFLKELKNKGFVEYLVFNLISLFNMLVKILVFCTKILPNNLLRILVFHPCREDVQINILEEEDFMDANRDSVSVRAELEVSDGNHPSQQMEDYSDHSDEETNIVGVKDKIHELARLSFNRYHMYFVISIVGRAGSGKTLVVREIFNQSQMRQHFDKHAFVSVSQNYKETSILAEIFQQVTEAKNHEKLSFEALQEKVRNVLARKRYLIVLDDVHTPDVWEKLKYAFPNSLNGSRLILTIRDANVATQIDPSFNTLVHLRPLTNDESWILFLRRVGRGISQVAELKHLKEDILHKCQGLPLMILVLGGLLASKEFNHTAWSRSLKQIKPMEAIGSLNDDLDPSNILDLGYQDLSSTLKACLHCLRIFPKSYEIRVRRLFQLWIAEGLVTQHGMDPEDVAEKYFEELEHRNMIEVVKLGSDGRPKACCVPDTLYDTFSSNASDMGYHHIHGKSDISKSNSPNFNIHSLAMRLDMLDMLPSVEYLQNLRSYICLERGVWPAWEVGNFLKRIFIKRGFGLLTLLDLERVYEPALPKKLGKVLPLLKYLGLRWTFLDSIPASVADLAFLETLDVKHTNITVLPVSIWKAKELRHLYLNDIHFEMSIHDYSSFSFSGGCPSKLRTLWGMSIGNRNPPIEWLKRLSDLRKLGLTCHASALEEISNWICQLGSLRILKLRSINEFSKPSNLQLGSMNMLTHLTDLYLLGKLPGAIDISQLPPNLRILTLSVSHLSQDPMPMLGKLEHLIVLKLLGNSYIGEEMICLQGGFPKLRVLKLWILQMLTQWTVKEGTMPALRELEIRYCQKLTKPDGFEKLTTLKELHLTNMDENFVVEVKECLAKNACIIKEKYYNNVK